MTYVLLYRNPDDPEDLYYEWDQFSADEVDALEREKTAGELAGFVMLVRAIPGDDAYLAVIPT